MAWSESSLTFSIVRLEGGLRDRFLWDLSLVLLIHGKLLLEGGTAMLLGGSRSGAEVGSLPGSQA